MLSSIRGFLYYTGRGLLSVNMAFLVLLFRTGLREAVDRLSRAYDEMRPFQRHINRTRIDDIADLVVTYCHSEGLEIGPGANPYCDLSNTTFLDRFPNREEGCVVPDIVSDAHDIPVPDNSYNFVLSSHTLEHLPNTLQSLLEWKRVVRPGGAIFLVLPHCVRTYDRNRSRTTFQHHLEDCETGIGYEDVQHLPEWESTVQSSIDLHPWTQKPEAIRANGKLNWDWMIANGKVHYHVWTQDEVIALLQHIGCSIIFVLEKSSIRPNSFVVVARVKKTDQLTASSAT